MKVSVFVTSITKTDHSGVIVEASNGSPEGPPFVRFQLPERYVHSCRIGKSYTLNIEIEDCENPECPKAGYCGGECARNF